MDEVKYICKNDFLALFKSRSLLINNIQQICFKRCVPHFNEPELNLMESSCLQRCTTKYIKIFDIVKTTLQETLLDELNMESDKLKFVKRTNFI